MRKKLASKPRAHRTLSRAVKSASFRYGVLAVLSSAALATALRFAKIRPTLGILLGCFIFLLYFVKRAPKARTKTFAVRLIPVAFVSMLAALFAMFAVDLYRIYPQIPAGETIANSRMQFVAINIFNLPLLGSYHLNVFAIFLVHTLGDIFLIMIVYMNGRRKKAIKKPVKPDTTWKLPS